MSYDGDLLVAVMNPDGDSLRYTYDNKGYTEAGKLVKTTDAARHEQVYTVDGNGFNLTESDWMGNITAYTYDTQNHVTSVTDPLGHTTTYTYDESGNQITSTDANGNTTSYTYDIPPAMSMIRWAILLRPSMP